MPPFLSHSANGIGSCEIFEILPVDYGLAIKYSCRFSGIGSSENFKILPLDYSNMGLPQNSLATGIDSYEIFKILPPDYGLAKEYSICLSGIGSYEIIKNLPYILKKSV